MEVDIWRGDWGLPSIDVQCLQVLSYAKFSGAPVKLNVTNNPFKTPAGSLPVFKAEDKVLSKFEDISAFLRQNNLGADYELSPKQCAEVVAYSQLVAEKLAPALSFVWWMDAKNFVEFSRPTYAKLLPFPLNFYYPGRYEQDAKDLMSALYREDEDPSVVETAVYKQAEECISMLSTKLGDKDYFYGQAPCSLDAVVFSHLAPLLKAPIPSAALQNHLKACPNLTRYVGRILQRYFLKDVQEYEKSQRRNAKKSPSPDRDTDFPDRNRNIIIAAMFATLAMGGFALSTGIIQVAVSSDEDPSEDESRSP